jgi:exodeoxyribonuclease VII large subunit
VRAPTPSAAADLVTEGVQGALADLVRLGPRLAGALGVRLERLGMRAERTSKRAEAAARGAVSARRSRLERLAGQIHALSPLRTLERGYAVPQDEDGAVLRSISAFAIGEEFNLRLADGRVRARTTEMEPIGAPGDAAHG